MSEIKDMFRVKRQSLELFVREQIIGPGAFNKRFFFLNKWEENEFKGQKLKDCLAINNISEVISEVPAYQYSSAILFPISITRDEPLDQEKVMNLDEPLLEGSLEEIAEDKADDENFTDDHTESASSKNQNYPNTCGIAFAVQEEVILSKDIKIKVRFRTYRKIKQSECLEKKLGYWVPKNINEIEQIIKEYFSHVFQSARIDDNLFVYVKENVDMNQYLYKLDYVYLDAFLKGIVLPYVDKAFPGNNFHQEVTKEYESTNYTFTRLKEEELIDEIKASINTNHSNYSSLEDLIRYVDIYKQLGELITELKTIFRKSSKRNKPTPIWESNFCEEEITLVNFQSQKRVERGELEINNVPGLFLSYQYLKSNGILYIKLILVNKNKIVISPNEPPQLNKKDEANQKAFFGIELQVEESRREVLQPYNPPHLREIDEEDNFNKLIYRQYHDYGEGYNTSVSWGAHINNSLRFIKSEFLPNEDTPKIDFKPSKIYESKIISRIEDSILSIRGLSTLSTKSNENILSDLGSLVSSYKDWIIEKKLELNNEDVIQGKEILEKQLRACESDSNRLDRNLGLLRKDNKAMAAFRIMNTAMFMQLHHSINVKDSKRRGDVFLPERNDENFYRGITLKEEYKWRSFQLAFVLLNIDAFVRPDKDDKTVLDLFQTGWPERNEIADLIWFPTGGGKTEAYLGIISFAIAYRRFTKGESGFGTTVLMRYTLRLLTLQQFQRASLIICALEVIRKDKYTIPHNCEFGTERITIGLFVGSASLPNTWEDMSDELKKIAKQLQENSGGKIKTNLPHTECPWCGGALFVEEKLKNINPQDKGYGINDSLRIMCNSERCTFYNKRPNERMSLPFRLFDEDIFKFPPTLLFGTVDKFASLANKVSTVTSERNQDTRRLFGKGYQLNVLPPELIIQDELHLLMGPLGSAVGLFEKAVDELCTYTTSDTARIRPKIITSTATTRNTDKQIFALFNRRSETFPKNGINCDDSFFAFYQRQEDNIRKYESNRRYVGLLPIGKTQVWMQLRVASICLAHRVKFISENFEEGEIFTNKSKYKEYKKVIDYYHTVLSYFNSLKEVGKTQSQLSHYLPGDLNLIMKNTLPWQMLQRAIKRNNEINYSELTGRLSGEEVKTNLSQIERSWKLLSNDPPPEFVISTNMISVGIDVSRFNTMIITSMPRNTAEYIQASSRVAREEAGIVFTVHHPFRSRDISHYQRFKEFHEKFYGYVEPISVTPFADKALERYLAMFLAVMIRHNIGLELSNNDSAKKLNVNKVKEIKKIVLSYLDEVKNNAEKLNKYLKTREMGINSNIEGIIEDEEFKDITLKVNELLELRWLDRLDGGDPKIDLCYRDKLPDTSLFKLKSEDLQSNGWNVKQSLREIAPSIVIKTVQQ